MFVVAKNNIVLPSADGRQAFPLRRGFIGEVPDWAASTPYFAALIADGKISVPESKKERDVTAAAEKPVKKAKKTAQ